MIAASGVVIAHAASAPALVSWLPVRRPEPSVAQVGAASVGPCWLFHADGSSERSETPHPERWRRMSDGVCGRRGRAEPS